MEPLSPAGRTRPAIIAHRGASRVCLENTLPAFQRAMVMGVDGIELDVHVTRDGVVVVHHDPTLALAPPRDGGAVAIAELTAEQVATHRLSSGDPIPTLEQVCSLVGGAAQLFVEVKAPQAEAAVVAVLEQHPEVRAAVHAFDHRIAVGVRTRRPVTPIGLLSASYPLDLRGVIGTSGATAFWQHADLIDQALVDSAHALGVAVIAWTVNSAPHARRLAAWGVDGLCTDIPDVISTSLTEAAPAV